MNTILEALARPSMFVLGIAIMICVLGAFCALRTRQRVAESRAFLGWARVSLLGRQTFLGMAREVKDAGGASYEVATLDGRSIRTSANAVHTVECVPFSVIEAEAATLAGDKAADAKNLECRLREWREHEAALDARITCLRNAIGDALAAEDPAKARASLTAALDLDDEKNEQRFPF